jgi:hypothetical protein
VLAWPALLTDEPCTIRDARHVLRTQRDGSPLNSAENALDSLVHVSLAHVPQGVAAEFWRCVSSERSYVRRGQSESMRKDMVTVSDDTVSQSRLR